MEQSESADENVRKIYISDSPVIDDNIEYEYVSSDIEDELEPSHRTKNQPSHNKQPVASAALEPVMAPQPDLSEVDELAKEAEYQRELQERLQQTTLDDQPSAAV